MKLCADCEKKIKTGYGPVKFCLSCHEALRREIVRIAAEEGHKQMKGA